MRAVPRRPEPPRATLSTSRTPSCQSPRFPFWLPSSGETKSPSSIAAATSCGKSCPRKMASTTCVRSPEPPTTMRVSEQPQRAFVAALVVQTRASLQTHERRIGPEIGLAMSTVANDEVLHRVPATAACGASRPDGRLAMAGQATREACWDAATASLQTRWHRDSSASNLAAWTLISLDPPGSTH